MTPVREPVEATKAVIIRMLRGDAKALAGQSRRYDTQAERTAAAASLTRVADLLERMEGIGAKPPTTTTEWAAQLTGYDARRSHQSIGDNSEFTRMMVNATRQHLDSLNEPAQRMNGVYRVDFVRRHVTTYADGGVYTGPWVAAEESPRVEWGLRFSSSAHGESQHPHRDEASARSMFEQNRRWLTVGGPEAQPETEEVLADLKSIELLRRVVDVRVDGEETPSPWVVVDTIEGRADR